MTKKIIAISNHASMLGGGEHSFFDLLSYLQDPWNVLAVVPGKGELATRLKHNGIDIEVISLPSIRPWYFLRILSSLKSYFNLCRKYRPILIYANGSRAAFYGGIVGRMINKPVIWHCRIADPDIYLDFILSRLSSRVIVNSNATEERFKSHFQKKIKVVYNGIDINWLRDRTVQKPGLIHNDWKIILVVARISKWKRHDLILSAFERIAEFYPNLHLICVGSSDELEPDWWNYLQDISRQSTSSNRIHWVGYVEDVRPWYQAAKMLVLTSENEPFGRVLVEAMACGVPVIASRDGGIPEIIRHGEDGLLIDPGDVDEIANAMKVILVDKTMREYIVRNAQKRAEYFDLDIHVKKMVHIFEDLIKH